MGIYYNSDVYYKIRRDAQGYWRWRARAWNHEIIATGEAYHNKADCLRAVEMMRGSSDGPVSEE